MPNRRIAGKLATAVLGGALLAGVGAGAALATPTHPPQAQTTAAATSAAAGDPQGPDCADVQNVRCRLIYLYNNTPFTFTFEPQWSNINYLDGNQWTPIGNRHWHDIQPAWAWGQPPKTLQPGEVMRMSKSGHSTYDPFDGHNVWLSYTFTDADGKRHLVQVHDDASDILSSFSADWDGSKFVQTTATFNMQWQPGAPPNSVGAFMTKPAEITIDAKTNPNGAANAMKLFDGATNKSYKLTAPPTWSQSDPVQGSAKLINWSSSEAWIKSTTGTLNGQSNSLSAELSWETNLSLLDLATVTVSASVEGGHQWGSTDEVRNGNQMSVDPGQVGWFVKTTQVQSVTGDFNFTAYNGAANYHVTNVTVSQQGVSRTTNGIPVPGTGFTPHVETGPIAPPR